MLSKERIEMMLTEIKKDERLTYHPATVFENAPLALIQLSKETQIHLLETILEIPLSDFPLKKIKS